MVGRIPGFQLESVSSRWVGCPARYSLYWRAERYRERVLLHFFKVNRGLRRPLTNPAELRLVGGLNFSYSRTITLQTKLPAGHYLILVSTYNPGTVGDFFLRIASPLNDNVTVREL